MSKVTRMWILGLPFAATTLGRTVTMVGIPLFGAACAFSGYQLHTVKLTHPECTSFADAGHKLVGPWFGIFSKTTMILTWVLEAIYMLIATANRIKPVNDQCILSCNINWTLIAAIILIIPTQCRDFHAIKTHFVIIAVVICIAVVIIEQAKNDDVTYTNVYDFFWCTCLHYLCISGTVHFHGTNIGYEESKQIYQELELGFCDHAILSIVSLSSLLME